MHLIDTSSWIDYFKSTGNPDIRDQVAQLLTRNEASWCEMVFLELQGSPNSKQSVAIPLLEPVLPHFSINQGCWKHAYQLARLTKTKGKPVPNTDALIYATALHHGLRVFHNDKHFDWLDDVTGHAIAERLLPS
jgi:predicted nucleic acid-binding protein